MSIIFNTLDEITVVFSLRKREHCLMLDMRYKNDLISES
jgi:hypothetical protein